MLIQALLQQPEHGRAREDSSENCAGGGIQVDLDITT